MIYIHPIWQMGSLLIALWALVLGWRRFKSLHLGQKIPFNRKRHVLAGKLALFGWLLGILGGVATVRYLRQVYFLIGDHAVLGYIMFPLIIFGIISGLYLERRPAPRKVLPLLHGFSNLVLVVLAIVQIFEGSEMLEHFAKFG